MPISNIRTCLKLTIPISLFAFVILTWQQPAFAQDDWRQSRSDRFTVVGDADVEETAELVAHLEGLEAAIRQFLGADGFRRVPPPTLIALDGMGDLRRAGMDEVEIPVFVGRYQTYLVITDPGNEDEVEDLFHSYVHAVVQASIPNAPLWVQEGLASFYSTTRWSEQDQQLSTGRPIDDYVGQLRNRDERLGLTRLSEITPDSEIYDDLEREGVFHAESWALVHFLITRDQGQGHDRMGELVRLMASGQSFEETVEDTFNLGFRAILAEFSEHIEGRSTYPRLVLGRDANRGGLNPIGELSEVEAATYLGQMLAAAGFSRDAEVQLGRAIGLGGDGARPYTAIAELLIDQGRFDEARLGLDRALYGIGSSHMTHYLYALSLIRQYPEPTERQQFRIERELRTAVDVTPAFADGYHELARVLIQAGDRLDGAAQQLEVALDLGPDEPEYLVTFSSLLIAQERFDEARTILLPLVDGTETADLGNRAREILQSIGGQTGRRGLVGEGFAEIIAGTERPQVVPDAPVADTSPAPPSVLDAGGVQLTRVIEGEQQSGLLTLIDCRDGLALTLEDGLETHIFFTDSPERVNFTSDTSSGSEVSCGIQEPPFRVVITFRPVREDSEFSGVPVKVEFVED